MEIVLLKLINLAEEHWFWFLIFGGTIFSILGNILKVLGKFLKQSIEYLRPGHWGIQRGMTWEELHYSENHFDTADQEEFEKFKERVYKQKLPKLKNVNPSTICSGTQPNNIDEAQHARNALAYARTDDGKGRGKSYDVDKIDEYYSKHKEHRGCSAMDSDKNLKSNSLRKGSVATVELK